MHSRDYPRVGVSGDDRLFAHVPVPTNYQELYQEFTAQGRESELERYVGEIKRITGRDIRLTWHETFGLKNISVGSSTGFDLDPDGRPPAFAEHNHGGVNTLVALAVAQEYVRQLLQSDETD